MNFDPALTAFVAAVQQLVNTYFAANFAKSIPPRIEIQEGGVKYIRLVQIDVDRDGKPTGSGCSAWAFVERATGNVLKPDGWKRPAKHARGNIYAPNPVAGMGPYGPGYLQ